MLEKLVEAEIESIFPLENFKKDEIKFKKHAGLTLWGKRIFFIFKSNIPFLRPVYFIFFLILHSLEIKN